MLDTEGRVVEATQANVFWARAGRLHTPALVRCGVSGVMRRRLAELARVDGVEVVEGDYGLDEVMNADEVFLCNSLIRIWPVASLSGTPFPRGPLTRRLQTLLSLDRG
jgi:4-amino-4-deoxychorismate lyase